MNSGFKKSFDINKEASNPFSFDKAEDVICETPFSAILMDKNEENVVFASEDGHIFYSSAPFKIFTQMDIPAARVTAICLSHNSRFLVVCQNGKILKLIDFAKKSVILDHTCKSKAPIVSLAFTINSEAFVAVNNEGLLYTFAIQTSGLRTKVSERSVFMKDLKITSAFAIGGDSHLALLTTKTEVLLSDLLEKNNTPIVTANQHERLSFKTYIEGENAFFFITSGKNLSIVRIKPNGEWKVAKDLTFKQDITEVYPLSAKLFVVVFNDQTLRLVKSNSFVGECYESRELTYSLSVSHFIIPTEGRLLILYRENFGYITFFNFIKFAEELIKNQEYERCLKLCHSMEEGAETVLGIPEDPLQKDMVIQKTVYNLMESCIKVAKTFDDVSDMIDACFSFSIIDFIKTSIFRFCDEHSMIYEYAMKMLDTKNPKYLICVNNALINKLSEMEAEKWTQDMSHLIKRSTLPFSHRHAVLNLAFKMNDHDLILHMFVNIFSDFISAANYAFGKEQYVPIISNMISGAYPEANKKVLITWILSPGNQNRLINLVTQNEDESLYKSLMGLLPIKISNCINITDEVFIDTVLRILPNVDYEHASLFITVAAKTIVKESMAVPPCSVNILTRWAFTYKDMLDTRERLLQIMNCMYPSIIVFDELIDYCEAAGFTEVLKHFCLPTKEYNRVVRTMAACPERRDQIFPFIRDHLDDREEIKQAVSESLQILILLDAISVLDLIFQHFPEMHEEFLSAGAKPVVRYTYIKAVMDDKRYSVKLTEEVKIQYFELLCQFSPDEVLPLITERREIKLDQALPLCIKYRVVDACVHIYNMLGNSAAAIKFVADELEFVMYTLVRTKTVINIPSLSGIAFVPELAHPVHLVKTALSVLEKCPAVGHTIEKMWTMIFKAFQVPLWMEHKQDPENGCTPLTLFFASFVVDALPRTSPEFVMYILNTEFSCLPPAQMKQILEVVVAYLNQRYTLNMTVERMVRDDCLELFHKTNSVKNKPVIASKVRCAYCNNPITGAGNVGAVAFQCGHIFHNTTKCGNFRRCPICHNDKLTSKGDRNEPTVPKIVRGERKLARVEFCLKNNYGSGSSELEGNGVYFCEGNVNLYEEKVKFNVAKEPLPTPVSVFMEI